MMVIAKRLAQFAACSIAMGATVGVCLWVWFVFAPSLIEQYAALPEPTKQEQNAEVEKVPSLPEQATDQTPADLALPLTPGASGLFVKLMQGALIAKGSSVGPAGANGNFNDDTLVALQAFQDNNALPVQPKCDRECWSALGLLAGP